MADVDPSPRRVAASMRQSRRRSKTADVSVHRPVGVTQEASRSALRWGTRVRKIRCSLDRPLWRARQNGAAPQPHGSPVRGGHQGSTLRRRTRPFARRPWRCSSASKSSDPGRRSHRGSSALSPRRKAAMTHATGCKAEDAEDPADFDGDPGGRRARHPADAMCP